MFYHAQGMLVNLKMIPSFQAAKYTFGVGDQFDASKQAKMSLFQFGFSRKKRKDNEREEGNKWGNICRLNTALFNINESVVYAYLLLKIQFVGV